MINEIFTELRNESDIHNGSIPLFPPTDKQGISPLLSNPPFKSNLSNLIYYENRQVERREEIFITKDLLQCFAEFK